jgi:hypothetical protein
MLEICYLDYINQVDNNPSDSKLYCLVIIHHVPSCTLFFSSIFYMVGHWIFIVAPFVSFGWEGEGKVYSPQLSLY